MYGLPPAIVYNEQTGRLEHPHAEIMRRMRAAHRLRARYRSMVVRRAAIAAFKAPWRLALLALSALRARRPRAPAPRARATTAQG
jgi:hypothetical protein